MSESDAKSGTQGKEDEKIKALEEQLAKEKEARAKLEKMHNSDDEFIKKQSNEIGELRKIADKMASLESAIADLKAAKPATGQEGSETEKKATKLTIEELESQVQASEAKKAATEAVFNALSNEDKKRYANDETFRREHLEAALEEVDADSVPESPWITAAKKEKSATVRSDTKKRIRELFKEEEKKRAKSMPSGSKGGEQKAGEAGAGDGKSYNPKLSGILGRHVKT